MSLDQLSKSKRQKEKFGGIIWCECSIYLSKAGKDQENVFVNYDWILESTVRNQLLRMANCKGSVLSYFSLCIIPLAVI